MLRSQYINTFDNRQNYTEYINSDFPRYPNYAYIKNEDIGILIDNDPDDVLLFGETNATEDFYVNINNIPRRCKVSGGYFSLPNINEPITIIDNLFYDNQNITKITKFNIDMSNVTNAANAFLRCNKLTYIDGIDDWDVTNLFNAQGLFQVTKQLGSLDLHKWRPCPYIQNIRKPWGWWAATMFWNVKLNVLNISGWDFETMETTQPSTTYRMFGLSDIGTIIANDMSQASVNIMMAPSFTGMSAASLSGFNKKIITDFGTYYSRLVDGNRTWVLEQN